MASSGGSGSGGGGGSGRKRWTERREPKLANLYDEYKKQEVTEKRKTFSLRHRSTAAPQPGNTIRLLSPDNAAVDADTEFQADPTPPPTTAEPPTSTPSPKPRKLVKDRIPRPSSHASPSGKGGSGVIELFARNVSKSNGHSTPEATEEPSSSSKTSRNRSKTFDIQGGTLSPRNLPHRHRSRTTSMNIPLSHPSSGAEYLASVPAETPTPSAQSIKSVEGRRSVSPTSSNADESSHSNDGKAGARRILHLMKTLNGRYSGSVIYRSHPETAWVHIYCSIEGEEGDLVYEPRPGDGTKEVLVAGLKAYRVKPGVDGETPILELQSRFREGMINLKLLTQVDFDSWYAALLYWQSLGPKASNDQRDLPSPVADGASRVEPPPRTSSARKNRHRKDSGKGRSRKTSSAATPREAPVIKIGRMIYWDTGAYPGSNGAPGTVGRPAAQRVLSEGTRRWRRINGQLRENGELKLSSDPDNSLITVVQLSQLSRCAIQRLHPSVMDDEYCIAVYPQYTSTPTDAQPGFVRPIFLSLETRVLYEVWYVLLRAFTIPQLYGPRVPIGHGLDDEETEKDHDVENMLATTTTDMFRMERSLNIRIVEAKMYAPSTGPSNVEQGFPGGYNKLASGGSSKSELHGYYAEVLLDNETRGKTTMKFDGNNPLWGESFDFLDLPPVLSSASVVIKRRAADAHAREQHGNRLAHEAHRSPHEQQAGTVGFAFDIVCGKVEIYLQELDGEKELEKWWPVLNSYNHRVGDVLIRARAEEGVILMARDYEPLGEVLHRFTNGITLQIAQMLPGELKNISDCFLNIFQVSGKVGDWLMALVEEEIDGIHKETPITKLRFDRRVGSEGGSEVLGFSSPATDREIIVRDMNKTATNEANLLFRGNTLLTKSLDSQMRRVGKEFLEASIGAKIREINAKDPECEVDPSRVSSPHELDRNWRRLLLFTQEVWKGIVAAKARCPVELRVIFRHIRACAEDRYGDFLRTVSYSSVSGFLFLRFFCPAVLNPQLFGLLKEDVKPRARRAFTLIAKSLQTLSNMASFGAKETWMEPMNAFLTQHRNGFKAFIDDVCYVPSPLSAAAGSGHANISSSTYSPDPPSSEANLSYTTPTTIMARLPPTSREGFPSLPYLIDQPRAYAELVQLWLDSTNVIPDSDDIALSESQRELLAAIKAAGEDILLFHNVCTALHRRTQDCLSRAERAERPNSASSFRWDELIDQLQTNGDGTTLTDLSDGMAAQVSLDALAQDTPDATTSAFPKPPSRSWSANQIPTTRPTSSGVMSAVHEGLRRAQLRSAGSDSATSLVSGKASLTGFGEGNASSAPSSDTENSATALPSYDREIRVQQQIREQVAAASASSTPSPTATRLKDAEKESSSRRKLRSPIVSALRKRNLREKEREREREGAASRSASSSLLAGHSSTPEAGYYTGHG